MSFNAFEPTINEEVWGSLMNQTPSGKQESPDFKNADGNLVRAKFKAPLRDAVKDLIGFLQHKSGQLQCDALDQSIAEGNRLLGLDKDSLEKALETRVDFRVTNARRKYGAQMLNQYTNELEKKRNNNCRVSGDKDLDKAQTSVDQAYGDLGYTPPLSSTNIQQAGMGGNMMVYLTIGAIAFAGFFFIQSTLKKGSTPSAPKT